ncbi:MAG: septal ring lytic transglycosylase RlpA family protein [Bacteroidota bacterium]|nr:septal ring lytic transglycosylase RlpA family protein [Bacteroidota bacterium]
MRNSIILLLVASLLINSSIVQARYKRVGIASYYGRKFHGRITTSGDVFDMKSLTAAHRSLPFGTIVKVFYYRTKKSVIVRINDRGPVSRARIIDLSALAAKRIGLQSSGIGKVLLTIIKSNSNRHSIHPATENANIAEASKAIALINNPIAVGTSTKCFTYRIQAGAYSDAVNATKVRETLMLNGIDNSVTELTKNGKIKLYKVFVGPFNNEQQAQNMLRLLSAIKPDAFIIEEN